MLKQAAAVLLVAAVLALGLLAQARLQGAEREAAVEEALNDPRVLEAYERKVEPVLGSGAPPLVYLDPASPPEARVYVVEWLDPRWLYLASLMKARVVVNSTGASVVYIDP